MARLTPDAVHVWRAPLPATPDRMATLESTLSADELARGQRFHFERDRQHFLAARGTLRLLLARYLEMAPDTLRFNVTPFGKPWLVDPPYAIQFNVSHAHGRALFAFAVGRRVGVDIEWLRPELTGVEIARRFFSPAEVAALEGLSPAERPAAFLRCWTRKEAFVKARGEGLSLPLDRFDVDIAPDSSSALLATRPDAQEAAAWRLLDLPAPPQYYAALAVEGTHWTLQQFDI